MKRIVSLFLSLVLLLGLTACGTDKKNADNTIVTAIPINKGISVSTLLF